MLKKCVVCRKEIERATKSKTKRYVTCSTKCSKILDRVRSHVNNKIYHDREKELARKT